MDITTDAIDQNGWIDPRYTCDSDNSSPELRWHAAPQGTKSYILIAEDPDAPGGTFSHWVVYEISADIDHLPAGISPQDRLPNGIRQGVNSFGKLGYQGPCPPLHDKAHRYFFRLYALTELPEIPDRASREQLLSIISPYILETSAIVGRYQRIAAKAG